MINDISLQRLKLNWPYLEELAKTDMKAKSFQSIMDKQSLEITKDLKNLSPKMFSIMTNIGKFMKDDNSVPTGKILFYSDFRSDGGSEAFELVLRSNGYTKFDHKDPQKEPGKRYTFITGSEGQEERRINKDHFNSCIRCILCYNEWRYEYII